MPSGLDTVSSSVPVSPYVSPKPVVSPLKSPTPETKTQEAAQPVLVAAAERTSGLNKAVVYGAAAAPVFFGSVIWMSVTEAGREFAAAPISSIKSGAASATSAAQSLFNDYVGSPVANTASSALEKAAGMKSWLADTRVVGAVSSAGRWGWDTAIAVPSGVWNAGASGVTGTWNAGASLVSGIGSYAISAKDTVASFSPAVVNNGIASVASGSAKAAGFSASTIGVAGATLTTGKVLSDAIVKTARVAGFSISDDRVLSAVGFLGACAFVGQAAMQFQIPQWGQVNTWADYAALASSELLGQIAAVSVTSAGIFTGGLLGSVGLLLEGREIRVAMTPQVVESSETVKSKPAAAVEAVDVESLFETEMTLLERIVIAAQKDPARLQVAKDRIKADEWKSEVCRTIYKACLLVYARTGTFTEAELIAELPEADAHALVSKIFGKLKPVADQSSPVAA